MISGNYSSFQVPFGTDICVFLPFLGKENYELFRELPVQDHWPRHLNFYFSSTYDNGFKNDSHYTHLGIIKTLNPWVKYVYNIPNQVYESFLIGKSYYKDNKSMGQVSLYRLKSTPLEKNFSGASWYKHTWPMPRYRYGSTCRV